MTVLMDAYLCQVSYVSTTLKLAPDFLSAYLTPAASRQSYQGCCLQGTMLYPYTYRRVCCRCA